MTDQERNGLKLEVRMLFGRLLLEIRASCKDRNVAPSDVLQILLDEAASMGMGIASCIQDSTANTDNLSEELAEECKNRVVDVFHKEAKVLLDSVS